MWGGGRSERFGNRRQLCATLADEQNPEPNPGSCCSINSKRSRDLLMASEAWSDSENDAIVADYFAMLASELAGHTINKAERNRALQAFIKRGRGSIEYKHQNISAILLGLGETWIAGYKPAFNFQRSLEKAVLRWLDAHPGWITRAPSPMAAKGMAESAALWIGPPPTMSNAPEPEEAEQAMVIARRYDVAERDERNRALGKAGEELVVKHERRNLASAGRHDLAELVRWVSDADGDGAGYDIASFHPDGSARLIEVKTTNGWERTPFHISSNELAVSEERRAEWCLVRLWNFSRTPRAFELYPPLETHVALTATSFRATLL
jgi:hypothetical protein